jgi:alkanesulfonate monooxygenase SsuD/methylene tetrahydromethanopterin reductase-like flavin-dependent oxidoreductase (luciferase family)
VNAHVRRPKIGVTRHIYIANTDREAEQVTRESYRVFYDNIQKLWRDFNTVVLAFPPEHETYHQAGASFSGTISSVENEIHTKTNGSINHGVSANARAITTDVIRASITAICHARALRMDIIGPAPARSHTITAPS